VINRPEFVRRVEEDVTALSVGVVGEQVEEDDGLEALLVIRTEVEVVIVGIVGDVLLERAGAERTVAQDGEGDEAKTERLAEKIRGDLAQREGAFWKVPQGLFAARRFVDGLDGFARVRHVREKGVVRAKHELAFEGEVAVLEGGL